MSKDYKKEREKIVKRRDEINKLTKDCEEEIKIIKDSIQPQINKIEEKRSKLMNELYYTLSDQMRKTSQFEMGTKFMKGIFPLEITQIRPDLHRTNPVIIYRLSQKRGSFEYEFSEDDLIQRIQMGEIVPTENPKALRYPLPEILNVKESKGCKESPNGGSITYILVCTKENSEEIMYLIAECDSWYKDFFKNNLKDHLIQLRRNVKRSGNVEYKVYKKYNSTYREKKFKSQSLTVNSLSLVPEEDLLEVLVGTL
ncbi:MAG TPA: hypothetical protein P5136_01435 [Methanofastidiosum sp.]|nr:hypothetical protein [Methanofastidiosum sp.]